MQAIITTLEFWIQSAGFWGVLGASIVEEVFSLIPSSVVQLSAGIFIMDGLAFTVTNVLYLMMIVALPAAIGVTIGSLVYVWLARKFGILFIEKYGKWVGVNMTHLRKLEAKFEKTAWDDVIFILLRAFPAVPAVALAVYAGIIEMSWKRYIISTLIGVFIRATALGFIGWLFRDRFEQWNSNLNTVESVVTLVLVGGLIVLVGWLLFKKHHKQK